MDLWNLCPLILCLSQHLFILTLLGARVNTGPSLFGWAVLIFGGKVSPIVTPICLWDSFWFPTFLYSQTPADTCWIIFCFCFASVMCSGDICKLELQKWTRLRFFANRHKQNDYKQNSYKSSKMFDAMAFPFKKTFPRSITWFAELDLGSQSTLTLLKFFYPIPFPLTASLLF